MLSLTLENLLQHLQNNKFDAQIQKETQQIVIIFKFEHKDYPLFIRICDDGNILQFVVFIPCSPKPNKIGDVARLLHLINKEMDIPGFCMDESKGVLFYRVIIPTFEHEITENLFASYIQSIQIICQTFSPLITAVALGVTSFDQVLQKTQETGTVPLKKK